MPLDTTNLCSTAKGSVRDGMRFALRDVGVRGRVLACLALLCLLSACGGGVSPVSTTGSAQISLNPPSIDFGNVGVGSSSTQTITIKDTGAADLSVSQVTLTGAGFSMSGLSVPLTVPAGQSTGFSVTFAPTTTGKATGSISVTNNATSSPVTVSLTGNGVAAQLTANPAAINFGNVTVGSKSTQSVTLQDTGSTSVTISQQPTVSGAGFSVSGLSTPATLGAGQTTNFNVTFAPAGSGNATGSVTVTSNASNPTVTVSLSGTGVTSVSHSVGLSWTVSTSPLVVGYNVYRGTSSGGPYNNKLTSSLVTGTTYTDSTVTSGNTYHYVVTAVDSSNLESSFSNEASAAVP